MSLGIVLSTELFSADWARVLLLIRVYWLVALKIILAGGLVSTRLAAVNRSTGRSRRLGRRVSRVARRRKVRSHKGRRGGLSRSNSKVLLFTNLPWRAWDGLRGAWGVVIRRGVTI
jgi:hypothetical protein